MITLFRKRVIPTEVHIPDWLYNSDEEHYDKVAYEMDNLFITVNNYVFTYYPQYKPEPGETEFIMLKDFTFHYNAHGRPLCINWTQKPNVSKPVYEFDPYFLRYVADSIKRIFPRR